jgi:TRAP-type uncharacterized transport system substrate-binding protein
MRAIFPMYDTPFQFLVLENSGTQSVAEMVGKRVGVGPRGGTSAAYFPEFFRKLNVSVNFVFGEWAELAAQVHRRELDVLAAGAGVPAPPSLSWRRATRSDTLPSVRANWRNCASQCRN